MHITGNHKPWGLNHLPLVLSLLLSSVFLALLLTRGTSGGDESEAIQTALLAGREGWHAVVTSPNAIRMHRLFWSAEKYLLDQFFLLVVPSQLYGQPILKNALLTMDGSLFMLLTAAIGWLHLKSRGYEGALASLAVAGLLVSSSAISFFAGGVLECLMCLLAMLLITALDTHGALSRPRFLLAALCGLCLIFAKEYALLFLLPLSLLLRDIRQRFWFAGLLLAGSVAWFFLFLGGTSAGGGVIGFYRSLVSADTFILFGARLMESFFSLPFGLIWCFPLLWIAGLSWRKNRRALLVKVSGIVLLFMFLALFPFSFGPGAVAGPRYIVPFLMVFLPEMADGMTMLRGRWRLMLFAVPVATLFFMPALDYRNSLLFRWVPGVSRTVAWPHADLRMHPGIFAWRVVAARAWDVPSIRLSVDLPYVVATQAIFPMSGLSRIIYALQSRDAGTVAVQADSRLLAVVRWLTSHRLDNILLWQAIRALLVLMVMGWLVHAAATLSLASLPRARRHLLV